jgi:ribulose-5-phosphate 4-epimerase/fuculose-1-phosphate aldolase
MTEDWARQEICRIGKSLFDRGYVHSSAGNISVKLDDGFLITPTDAVMGFLEPAKISKVDLSGAHVSGDAPSKTLGLHRSVYAATGINQPLTSCIIHTHSTYCVALTLNDDGCTEELLEPMTPYQVMKVGRVPLIPYKRPGDPRVIELVEKSIDRYSKLGGAVRCVMLSALGPVVWHDSPSKAMATLEELEESAKLTFLLGKSRSLLTSSEIQELKEVFNCPWALK